MFVTTIFFCHTIIYFFSFQYLCVFIVTTLYSSFWMMYKLFNVFSLIDCYIMSSYAIFYFQIITHYFRRIHICYWCQMTKYVYSFNIGYITNQIFVSSSKVYVSFNFIILVKPLKIVNSLSNDYFFKSQYFMFYKNIK